MDLRQGSAKPDVDHKYLCDGDFITLFIESESAGYATVGSFSDEHVSVYTESGDPPNFERSCVFQVISLGINPSPGQEITYVIIILSVHADQSPPPAPHPSVHPMPTIHTPHAAISHTLQVRQQRCVDPSADQQTGSARCSRHHRTAWSD
jgi:hypothetical protein